MMQQSREFATRLQQEPARKAVKAKRAFELAFQRDPNGQEQTAAENLFGRMGWLRFAGDLQCQ